MDDLTKLISQRRENFQQEDQKQKRNEILNEKRFASITSDESHASFPNFGRFQGFVLLTLFLPNILRVSLFD